jgi:thioredoxin-related protein
MKKVTLSKLFFLLFSLGLLPSFLGQTVNWVSIEQAFLLQKQTPKPILVDFYTEWCGWCKRMDATTYKDAQLVSYINQYFYCVKFDAERKDPITLNGQKMVNPNPSNPRSSHQYASNLGIGSFPTTVFYDKEGNNVTQAAGYLQANEMVPILVYFKEHLFQVTDVNSYAKSFKTTFSTSVANQTFTKKINWYSWEVGLEKAKKEQKRVWIQAYTSDCINCKVMDSTVFTQDSIIDLLNQNFICIKFDGYSTKTISLQEKQFASSSTLPNSLHQVMIGVYGSVDKVSFPNTIILEPNQQLVTSLASYIDVKNISGFARFLTQKK